MVIKLTELLTGRQVRYDEIVREPGHTRERLLEIALDLFTRHGYEATSLQQLADQLGVSKAALYYYFPAKRDILRALIEPMTADLEARLDDVEARGPGTKPDGLANYIDFLIGQRLVLTFMHQDTSWLAEMPELHARQRSARRRLADVLVGKSLDLSGRVRFTVAMAGIQAAVALHPEAQPGQLRDTLLGCIKPFLEPLREELNGCQDQPAQDQSVQDQEAERPSETGENVRSAS
jgi:AcrR family transcriptional regulator